MPSPTKTRALVKRFRRFFRFLSGFVFVLAELLPMHVEACRLLPAPPDIEKVLWVHVEGPCLPGERENLAVRGPDILEALENGRSIDLDGVLVVGEVMLDLLPLQDLSGNAGIPPAVRERLQQQGLEAVHLIPQSISIRHSHFEHVVATNLVEGALLVLGEVDFTGTVFLQSVDFSKTVFVSPVIFSQMRVDYEGFFIGTHFDQRVDFSQVTFGTHSRFHKAHFRDQVSFANTRFAGVAELLEVSFQRKADFSRSHFSSGAGFSGSVFSGPADFADAKFEQEIYFRFTEFKQSVSFQHAQFQDVVDFTNARFEGEQNFSAVMFHTPPDVSGSNLTPEAVKAQEWWSQKSQLGIFAGLAILVLVYLGMSKRKKST